MRLRILICLFVGNSNFKCDGFVSLMRQGVIDHNCLVRYSFHSAEQALC